MFPNLLGVVAKAEKDATKKANVIKCLIKCSALFITLSLIENAIEHLTI